MLNPIAQQWVTALRSGTYRQGRNCLTQRGPDQQDLDCCLGVLCKLAVQAGVIPQATWNGEDEVLLYRQEGDPSYPWTDELPPAVKDWAGLASVTGKLPAFGIESGERSLALLNDRGLSFEEIADVIEANPPGLFLQRPS